MEQLFALQTAFGAWKDSIGMHLSPDIFGVIYLVAGVFFIFGLKGLSHPSTARRGNFFAMVGMVIAIATTFMHPDVKDLTWVIGGMAVGAVIGVPIALRIKMTAMPQLVAILHSFVGLAAVLVAAGMFMLYHMLGQANTVLTYEVFIGAFIGAITFTGSVVAFGKLQGIFRSAPVVFPGQHLLNLLIFVAMVLFGLYFAHPTEAQALLAAEGIPVMDRMTAFWIMVFLAFVLGVTLIIPIGGADMPVVVSMLNSYSGWAAAATGFTLGNVALIVTGALVGASGAILSYIMCRAMNRSFISVILGGFGAEGGASSDRVAAAEKGIREAAVDDAAYMMGEAAKVIVVPGYGMAVAQAQHAIKDIYYALTEKGIEVKFAIHPVAGRMPGHMNVLLAEADVPYDVVFELEEINNEFASADAVFVVGANDVVNPDAKNDPGSPLYGMPILDAYKAKMVFVNKRSLNPGYAGVENSLFYMDNTYLVFGDAKSVCEHLAAAIRSA
jgi:NAD(P) transhydrogenase subunit beta